MKNLPIQEAQENKTLTKEQTKQVKDLIYSQLIKLFYTLYIKDNIWKSK
jgi:hypothetical protein